MKRLLNILLFILITLPSLAQEPVPQKKWYQRIFSRPTVIVHDTVYVEVPTFIEQDTLLENPEGTIPMPFDTLNTADKFLKVILFDNGSWTYYDIPKPDLPDSISSDHWVTNQVHAYMDIKDSDLPEEIDLLLCDSLHKWHLPSEGRVVSPYKVRKGHKHQGVDLGAGYGTPIYAAFDGIVRVALPPKLTGGYGNVVVLRHANGLETYYGHLSYFTVVPEDMVKAGEIIGYCGATGRATGPHLHFEIRYMGQTFDPERIFDFQEGTLRDSVFTLKNHYFSIYSHEGQTEDESQVASRQAEPTEPVHVSYTVKQGDTLSSIAKKHGTTVNAICKLNNIKENKVLRIGQKLLVK